jgi:hypothetical protein
MAEKMAGKGAELHAYDARAVAIGCQDDNTHARIPLNTAERNRKSRCNREQGGHGLPLNAIQSTVRHCQRMTNCKRVRIYTGADYREHATIARPGETDKDGSD